MMSLCLSIGTSGWISFQFSVVSCQWSVGFAFGRASLLPSRRVVLRYGGLFFGGRAGGEVRRVYRAGARWSRAGLGEPSA